MSSKVSCHCRGLAADSEGCTETINAKGSCRCWGLATDSESLAILRPSVRVWLLTQGLLSYSSLSGSGRRFTHSAFDLSVAGASCPNLSHFCGHPAWVERRCGCFAALYDIMEVILWTAPPKPVKHYRIRCPHSPLLAKITTCALRPHAIGTAIHTALIYLPPLAPDRRSELQELRCMPAMGTSWPFEIKVTTIVQGHNMQHRETDMQHHVRFLPSFFLFSHSAWPIQVEDLYA